MEMQILIQIQNRYKNLVSSVFEPHQFLDCIMINMANCSYGINNTKNKIILNIHAIEKHLTSDEAQKLKKSLVMLRIKIIFLLFLSNINI